MPVEIVPQEVNRNVVRRVNGDGRRRCPCSRRRDPSSPPGSPQEDGHALLLVILSVGAIRRRRSQADLSARRLVCR